MGGSIKKAEKKKFQIIKSYLIKNKFLSKIEIKLKKSYESKPQFFIVHLLIPGSLIGWLCLLVVGLTASLAINCIELIKVEVIIDF